ncbi:MAG: type II toxin-antitoxin system Phd/YefM family antitoxin [Candidatus Hydrogenedentes bacterium]|nr:type II toxin-antitoxin system Phd/YefM family antitoxin [Candidatus Hydrogenedentota bacterium]
MKFLTVRDLRTKAARIWRDLPQEKEMVITNNGRPIAILSAASESNLEDSLRAVRQARAMQAVAELQRESVRRGSDKVTLKQINAEISSARKKRAR